MPRRCSPFSLSLEYEHGIFHAKGGLGSITARMGEIAEEMGVDIRLSTPVKSLIYEGKTVTGVRIEGSEMLADKVVVNADFRARHDDPRS